jgi:hypothetical protein
VSPGSSREEGHGERGPGGGEPTLPEDWPQSMGILTPEGGAPVPEEMWWRPPEGVELTRDTAPAEWIEERLSKHRWATVASIVPEGFSAYARVLHPAYQGPWDRLEAVRWSAVAERSGRRAHRLMQFGRIANIGDDLNAQPSWGQRPSEGTLPKKVSESLIPILGDFTSAPQVCWFCLWDGFGDINPRHYKGVPRVETPGRTYLLLRGGLDSIHLFAQTPNIVWPDDGAWCLATEIDLDSTYVGASEECIERILLDPRLEAFPAYLEDRVDVGSDEFNA